MIQMRIVPIFMLYYIRLTMLRSRTTFKKNETKKTYERTIFSDTQSTRKMNEITFSYIV